MGAQAATQRQADQLISRLVTTALQQDELGGLSEMLKCIAQLMGADACILWEATPTSDFKATPPTASLFALAQWFGKLKLWSAHNLGLDTVSGCGVLSGQLQHVKDARTDPRVDFSLPFFQRTNVTVFCSVPILFQDGTPGALNLYRVRTEAFDARDLDQVRQLAELVPDLYQAIRDRVSFKLLRELDLDLQGAEGRASGEIETLEEVKKTLEAICKLVAGSLQALECSIFLEDRLEAVGRFEAAATTHPPFVSKTSYVAGEPGLTPWVLHRGRSVKILDLACFKGDLPSLSREYPGISWEDRNHVLQTVHSYLELQPSDVVPPISFMCSPIQTAGRLLGAIRCCAALRPPYYFAEREVNLLELVATRIGQYWDNWLRRREAQEENRSLRNLVGGVSTLHKRVQQELRREVTDERAILSEALRVGQSAIPGADLLAALTKRADTSEQVFVAREGATWSQLDEREFEQLRSLRPGGRVRRVITKPLDAESENYGNLLIAGTGEREFPRQAEAIAGLLAEEMGLYHYLAATVRRSREARKELENVAQEQQQTYEDLGHQIKTPVMTAHSVVGSLLRSRLPPATRTEFLALRSQLSRARSVSWSIHLFAELASKGELQPARRPLDVDELLGLIERAAGDQQQRFQSTKAVEFRVQASGFHQALGKTPLFVDRDLLEHAIVCLLDNAGKYCVPKSKVDIFGGSTGTGRLHLTIRNKGLRIRPQDVGHCTERGWRGEEAKAVTGEGSGVGLWLAHHIMRAHGGELLIIPTTGDWQTEVKLVFPVRTR